jgi:hypothetical protein
MPSLLPPSRALLNIAETLLIAALGGADLHTVVTIARMALFF